MRPVNQLVPLDPDAFDAAGCSIYSDPPESIVDMIEEERCLHSPDGTHVYINGNGCNYCGTAAPWIRRDQCRVA